MGMECATRHTGGISQLRGLRRHDVVGAGWIIHGRCFCIFRARSTRDFMLRTCESGQTSPARSPEDISILPFSLPHRTSVKRCTPHEDNIERQREQTRRALIATSELRTSVVSEFELRQSGTQATDLLVPCHTGHRAQCSLDWHHHNGSHSVVGNYLLVWNPGGL